MEEIIYGLAFVSYALFIIRFILSWIGGDFDIDGDLDLSISDIVSFKGLTHFLMGFSGWLSVRQFNCGYLQWYDYLIALCLGVIFVVMLFGIYKAMLKLESKPVVLVGRDLIGRPAKIYAKTGYDGIYYQYIVTISNGNGTSEYDAISTKFFSVGDVATITDFNGAYYSVL